MPPRPAAVALLLASTLSRAAVAPDDFDYDLFVIGGGSGGLACAKEAASLGARVGLCDFVKPSPRGTRWGIGGTCVNVGCIPKKLMHRAGQLRHILEQDAPAYGYVLGEGGTEHSWATLIEGVQSHVRSLNFGYRSALMKAGVRYENKLGRLGGGNEVQLVDAKGRESSVRARHIVVAVGGRPNYPPSFEGAEELCITSDDIFTIPSSPGKTLVVGGGYVALECAGFLRSLGCEVTIRPRMAASRENAMRRGARSRWPLQRTRRVRAAAQVTLMLRSVPLRGFDMQCAEMVLAGVEADGTHVLRGAVPLRASRAPSGRILVRWQRSQKDLPPQSPGSVTDASLLRDSVVETEFDTVLVATGRTPDTAGLNLESVGLSPLPDGKIEAHDEATAAPNVFVIGDAASEAPSSRPELTPVATKAGVLLARRLYGGGDETLDPGV